MCDKLKETFQSPKSNRKQNKMKNSSNPIIVSLSSLCHFGKCLDMLESFGGVELARYLVSFEAQFSVAVVFVTFATCFVLKYCDMDLMRVKGNKNKAIDSREKLKDIYRRKDQQIRDLQKKLKEMEEVMSCMKDKPHKENATDIFVQYEELIKTVLADNDRLKQQNVNYKELVEDLRDHLQIQKEQELASNVTISRLERNVADLKRKNVELEQKNKILEGKAKTIGVLNRPIKTGQDRNSRMILTEKKTPMTTRSNDSYSSRNNKKPPYSR